MANYPQRSRWMVLTGFITMTMALLFFVSLAPAHADPNAPLITVTHVNVNGGNSVPTCGNHFQNGLGTYLFPQYRYGKPAVLNGNNPCPTQPTDPNGNGYLDQSGLGISPSTTLPTLPGCTPATTMTVAAVWHFNNPLWGGTLLPQPMTASQWSVKYTGQLAGDISGTLNFAYTLDETLNNPTGWPGSCPYTDPNQPTVNNNGCADAVNVSVNGTFQIVGAPGTCSLQNIGFQVVPSASPCPAQPTNANPSAVFVSGERADNKACLYVKVIPPLAVQLAYFEAIPEGQNVRTLWETYSEVDSLGFNIWRGTSLDEREKVNSELILSQSPGGGGAAYEWLDETVPGAGTYFYWLEDVDVSGNGTFHSPVSVTIMNSPTAVTMSGLTSDSMPAWGNLIAPLLLGLLVVGIVINARRVRRG